ncbi:hypothetical protein V8F06_009318 [Rhypophila decipiens]
MIISLPCLQNCLVFLYRGVIHLQGDMGSSPITSTGHGHAIKNEEFLGLDRDTDIFILEQGPMRGACAGRQEEIALEELGKEMTERRQRREEEEEKRRQSMERKFWGEESEDEEGTTRENKKKNGKGKEKTWDKLVRKIRREPEPEPEGIQCAQH